MSYKIEGAFEECKTCREYKACGWQSMFIMESCPFYDKFLQYTSELNKMIGVAQKNDKDTPSGTFDFLVELSEEERNKYDESVLKLYKNGKSYKVDLFEE